jgi:hypothetical protein
MAAVRPAQYLVKRRESDGMYTHRSMMGTRRGLRWGPWSKPWVFPTLAEAEARLDVLARSKGLGEVAIFHRGKKIKTTEPAS